MREEQTREVERHYAILTHDHPFFHWDLLLDAGEVAWTWRLLDEPSGESHPRAERIADHRRLYLDYEGPVSGNRGSVTRWDWGTYSIVDQTDDLITVQLRGTQSAWLVHLPRK